MKLHYLLLHTRTMVKYDELIREFIKDPYKFRESLRDALHKEPVEEKPKKEPMRNQPVEVLLDWFCNVKGKRIEANRQLRQRFLYLDYEYQIKVMDLFIERSKGYRTWCYDILTKWREPRYDDKLIALWQEYKERKCAWTIVSQLPAEKVLLVADSIVNCIYGDYLYTAQEQPYIPVGLYYTMCKKLGRCKGFTIKRELLRYHCNGGAYLNLLNYAGLQENEEDCFAVIRESIIDELRYYKENLPREDENGKKLYTVVDKRIQNVLREVVRMGYEELALNILRWDISIMSSFKKVIANCSIKDKPDYEFEEFIEYSLNNLPDSVDSLRQYNEENLKKTYERLLENQAVQDFVSNLDLEVSDFPSPTDSLPY